MDWLRCLDDIIQIVDGGHVGEEFVTAIRVIAEEPKNIMHSIDGSDERGGSTELGGLKSDVAQGGLDPGKVGVVKRRLRRIRHERGSRIRPEFRGCG